MTQYREVGATGERRALNGVLAAAYGVDSDFVRTFLETFRVVNTSARVILLVWESGPLRQIAGRYEAELSEDRWFCRSIPRIRIRSGSHGGDSARKRVRITELIGRSNRFIPRLAPLMPELLIRSMVSLAVSRFFHIRDILSRDSFGHVLLSDSRDVLFQADPFAAPVDLELAQESGRFGEDPQFNDAWLVDGFGPEALKAMEGRHHFCSGTILGSHHRVLEHVRAICRCVPELHSWKYGGVDQAIHNYLIANRMGPEVYTISTNRKGRIMTAAPYMNARIVDGLLVDEEGQPFPIVHQYDRLSPETRASLRILREAEAQAEGAIG